MLWTEDGLYVLTDGTPLTGSFWGSTSEDFTYSIAVSDTNANYEYFFPRSQLLDKDGIGVDLTGTAGFDGVGQILEEVVVSGTHYKFDISSYSAGIYFVKTETSVARFIK